MNNLINMSYNGNNIRTIDNDGQVWWILKDVCAVLGISHIKDTVKRLDEDEVGQTEVMDKLGRYQKAYIVNESGLYSVILRSDKPEAKPFRRWITHEVLPELRRTGSYSLAAEPKYKTWYGVPVLTSAEAAQLIGTTPDNLRRKVYRHLRYGFDYFTLTGSQLRLFKFENRSFPAETPRIMLIRQSALEEMNI